MVPFMFLLFCASFMHNTLMKSNIKSEKGRIFISFKMGVPLGRERNEFGKVLPKITLSVLCPHHQRSEAKMAKQHHLSNLSHW
jgi:hypothetical protein